MKHQTQRNDMASKKPLASLRVLYVEDDLNTQEEIAFFLEGVVNALYLAADGKEGLELYKKHQPDLIITDIQMPVMSGIEMIETLRKDDRKTPVIITTAYNETNYLFKAINIGVCRYILKPIDFSILTSALRDIVEDQFE